MTNDSSPPSRPGRRGFLKAGVAAGAGLAASGAAQAALTRTHTDDVQRQIEPFYGAHQGGIVTPQQSHAYVAAFDLKTDKRDEVIALLREWTQAAARMTQGQTAGSLETADDKSAADSADIPDSVKGQLDTLAQKMASDDNMRIQLLAYASGTADEASRARRMSLSRALSVRSYLIKQGVRSTRMDVRALGNNVQGSPADRVDIIPKAQ